MVMLSDNEQNQIIKEKIIKPEKSKQFSQTFPDK